MVNLKTVSPAPGSSVTAGSSGKLIAEVSSSAMVMPECVKVKIYNSQGTEVYAAEMNLSGTIASIDYNFPAKSGEYSVDFVCGGLFRSNLAHQKTTFVVVDANKKDFSIE